MDKIAEAIREILFELDRAASAREIIQTINQRYPNRWQESSIKAHLYGCSVNHPPAYIHHRSQPKILFDLGGGKYELYEAKKHGEYPQGVVPKSNIRSRKTKEDEKMPLILINDEKYTLRKPKNEAELELMVKEHSRQIFGRDSLYFDIKPELRSATGIGSKPDGFVIVLDSPAAFYIVENEMAEHGVHDHVVTQISKFNSAFKKAETRTKIVEALYDNIKKDQTRYSFVKSKNEEPYKFLTDIVSSSPTVIIIIDRLLDELKDAIDELPLKAKLVEFKTFKRGVDNNAHAHFVSEPVQEDTVAKYVEKEGFACLMCKNQPTYDAGLIVEHLEEKHDIFRDDQIIDGWNPEFQRQADLYLSKRKASF